MAQRGKPVHRRRQWTSQVLSSRTSDRSMPVKEARRFRDRPLRRRAGLCGAGCRVAGHAAGLRSTTQQKALDIFESARELFKRGDYQTALSQTNRAVAILPNDSLLHEFRALCLFALKDYQQAAAALYAVLSAGPGWDWATLSGLYPNVDVYEQQLRALESYRNDNFDVGAPHFLLAYHYMLAGHNEPAADELREVVRLQPGDQLAAQLLKGLTTPASPRRIRAMLAGGPEPSASEGPALMPAAPVELASIVGHWKASRPDGSKFSLNLGGRQQIQLGVHAAGQAAEARRHLYAGRQLLDSQSQRPERAGRAGGAGARRQTDLQAGWRQSERSRVDLHPLEDWPGRNLWHAAYRGAW